MSSEYDKYHTRIIDVKARLYKTALKSSKKRMSDPGRARKKKKRTAPEKMMMRILDMMGLPYEEEYSIPFANSYRVFDFRIGDDLLIEVDGDFFHGNSEVVKKYTTMHIKNKQNDIIKNWIARKKGFKLLRFWQSDIQHDEDYVITEINKHFTD
jgi:very-short-patch-repair endonuclease